MYATWIATVRCDVARPWELALIVQAVTPPSVERNVVLFMLTVSLRSLLTV